MEDRIVIDPSLVFLDAETLPTIDPSLITEIEASISPPGSMKKPETIERWWAEEGDAARKEAVRKTSLDGGTGRLAALSWAWSDQPVVSAHTAMNGAWSLDREHQILEGFFNELSAFERQNGCAPTLCGHNIAGFDIRWLWKRSIILGIQPPWWWPIAAKPWDQNALQDTMILWEGPKGRISQDRLARTLGLRGKGAIDGSMVADLWDAGEHEAIRTYCADDVVTVRKIWCRIVGEDAPAEDEDQVVEQVVEEAPVKRAAVVIEGRVSPGFLLDDVKEKEAA